MSEVPEWYDDNDELLAVGDRVLVNGSIEGEVGDDESDGICIEGLPEGTIIESVEKVPAK